MMTRHFVFALLMALLFIHLGCSPAQEVEPITNEEVPERVSEPTDMDLVTGIALMDALGQPTGTYGVSNEKLLVYSTGETIRAFPVPATEQLILPIQPTAGVDYWIVPGEQSVAFAEVDFPQVLSGQTYDQDELVQASVLTQSVDSVANGSLAIDISGLTPGFYRLFTYVQAKDLLAWQNIYVSADGQSVDDILPVFERWE